MKKHILTLSAAIAGLLTPVMAYAQYIPQGGDAKVLFFGALGFLKYIPQMIFAVAIIGFLLLVVHVYIIQLTFIPMFKDIKSGDSGPVFKAILGLFLIFAIYGIIAVISNTLGIGVGGKTPPQPEIPVFDGVR